MPPKKKRMATASQRVRFDPESGLGSVLDVIGTAMGASYVPAGMRWVWRDLRKAHPALSAGVVTHRFPGAGQRGTPAASSPVLRQIAAVAREWCGRRRSPGHLYAVTCPSFFERGVIKVGMTTGTRERLLHRYSTCWPEAPRLVCWVPVAEDVVRAERCALAALRPHVVRGEFVSDVSPVALSRVLSQAAQHKA